MGKTEHSGARVSGWWEREDLHYDANGNLCLGGQGLLEAASRWGTPTFVYSADRIRRNLDRLQEALATTSLPYKLYYAMKANRFPPLLTYLKTIGLCGIDVCSSFEMLQAESCGFRPDEISYTAVSGDDNEWDVLAKRPDLRINCDSIAAVREVGARCPGRSIGIRINPASGVGYRNQERLSYSGAATTKFGIYRDRFGEALHVAREFDLRVERIHFHTGCGYLNPQLDALDEIFQHCSWFLQQVDDLREVNIGGGLGVPLREDDEALDLRRWCGILDKYLGPLGVEVSVEPGDYIVKDGGILLLSVTYVERKQEIDFVGVNGGFPLAIEPVFYDLPCEPVPVRRPEAGTNHKVTLAGNINEALDIWAREQMFPTMQKGDFIALLNAGGYASSMSSNHCLLGRFSEFLIL